MNFQFLLTRKGVIVKYMSETNTTETNVNQSLHDKSYEYNSFMTSTLPDDLEGFFGCDLMSMFSDEEIRNVLKNPIVNHAIARRLSMYVYNTNGIVANTIDYMVSMPCLDRVVYGKKRLFHTKKLTQNKDLLLSTLEQINDKQFIRDVLFTDMVEGTSFYYLDTTQKTADRTKFMRDFDVENIMEICDIGINAVLVPLPYSYSKIVGRKNGRYVMAFNLEYFDRFYGDEKTRKLRKFPSEISKAYESWHNGNTSTGNWLVLDNDHTIVHKIKCKTSEPWGRPLAIAAIPDILYQDEFIDTKRNVLREINSQAVIQTFPEGKDKGSCSLTKSQQEHQHEAVKGAVLNKKNRIGTTFVSVAAGTKIDTLDINGMDIFDEKNEGDLTDKIAVDLGFAAQLLGASSTGTFAGTQHNLEMINAQIYSWIQEIQKELNFVINACVIKDPKNKAEVYYLPTSLVNRKNFFDMMKSLYMEAGGSYTFLVAATGLSPEVYFNILDEEVENKIFDKYLPHKTSYTLSSNDSGRPETDSPSESTVVTRQNNSNNMPKPSTS